MDRRLSWFPLLPALALAGALSAAWVVADWSNLSALRLPDTDDAMRLQQVRDWLAGQAFGDVSQHRLGGGLAMHWSRVGDLVPAAVIMLLRPVIGQHAAEIAAVVVWPLLQLTALLLAIRSIAARIAPGAAGAALVLAALAYPTVSLFMPGRIDHHALQVLLVLVQVRALLAASTLGAGAVAGTAVALGAVIGLETLPFALLTGAIVAVGWWHGSGARQVGFGLSLAAALFVLAPFASPSAACDTIAPLLPAAIAAALALAALARVRHRRGAWLAVATIGAAAVGWRAAQPCLGGPYGAVDPIVARLWLAKVAEAQPLLSASFAQMLAQAGLLVAGLSAGGALAWRRGGGWWIMLAFQATGCAIALAQLRGVYVGAALGVIPLAQLLVDQRARGRLPAVLGLWIVGAGISYPLAAAAMAPAIAGAPASPSCTSPAALAPLAALPPGAMMAPIDVGAYAIAATRHRLVAAPYHRNNAGNLAMYRLFLGPPATAARVARAWRIDYVVTCPGGLGVDAPPNGSIAAGAIPAWLKRSSAPGAVPAIYDVDRAELYR